MSNRQEQAKRIYLDALDIEQHEQTAYVAAKCDGDELLRLDVVSLLEHGQRLDGFLASSTDLDHAAVEQAAENLLGTHIGPYQLLQEIGEGGMGVVYLADQQEPVRRQVAIKVVKPGMDSRQVIARFDAERQTLAMMDHPNIARMIDAGTTDQGRPYFVMELVRGMAINDFCDQQRLSVDARLELFLQVCQAVQHAHQKGIIHRDLKPTNVLVALRDNLAVPKVIDFGIAKAFGPQLIEQTLFTGIAHVVGTPLYMSPEQAEMNQVGVDTRSDVYSMGVILYELLTGTTPFHKDTLNGSNFDEFRRLLREKDPPRPSSRLGTFDAQTLSTVGDRRCIDPNRIASAVRGELDWIVMKALEKDRNRRFESASGLAADVQRYLTDEAVQACPPSKAYRFQKFARRNKAMLATSCLVAVALIIGTAVSTWQAVRATLAEAAADDQRALAFARDLEAKRQASEAIHQRDLARQQESLSREREESLRRYRFAVDMQLAGRTWSNARSNLDVDQVRLLLAQHEPTSSQKDLRSFAWYYLKQLCGPDPRATLSGHAGAVYHLDITPDGKTLASCGLGGEALLWDLPSGRLRHRLPAHIADVNCVAFTPDGRTLATCSDDSTVKFWDSVSGEEKVMQMLTGFSLPVHRVQLSSDGKLLIAGELTQREDAAVTTVWDLYSRHIQNRMVGFFPLALTSDGHSLATTSADNLIRIWDAATGQLLHVLPDQAGSVRTAAFSPNGQALAVGCDDGAVRVWNSAAGTMQADFRLWQSCRVHCVAWSEDERLLAAGDEEGVVQVWDVATHLHLLTLRIPSRGTPERVRKIKFTPDGSVLASACDDGTVKLWDMSTAVRKQSPPIQPASITSISFSADGKQLATNAGRNECRLWNVRTGDELLVALNPREEEMSCIAFSSGPTAAQAQVFFDREGLLHVEIIHHITEAQRVQIEIGEALVTSLTFSPEGSVLAGTCTDSVIRLWDAGTGKELHRLSRKDNRNAASRVGFSPNGTTLVYADGDDLIQMHLASGAVRCFDTRHAAGANCVAYAPDSLQLAIGTGKDRRISIYDAGTGKLIIGLVGHESAVHSLAFSPDGRTLASGGEQGELKLWDLDTSQELLNLVGHTGSVRCLAFSPDGQTLASAGASADGERGELRFWHAIPASADIANDASGANSK